MSKRIGSILSGIIIFIILVLVLNKKGIINFGNSKNDDLPFAGKEFVRYDNGKQEHIYFGKDGTFSYFIDGDTPVDGFDSCESYKYNATTEDIKLTCYNKVSIDSLKVINVGSEGIILSFNGEFKDFSTLKVND